MQNIVLVQSLRTYMYIVQALIRITRIFHISYTMYSSGAYLNGCIQTLTTLQYTRTYSSGAAFEFLYTCINQI